jgi:hypothetical protein
MTMKRVIVAIDDTARQQWKHRWQSCTMNSFMSHRTNAGKIEFTDSTPFDSIERRMNKCWFVLFVFSDITIVSTMTHRCNSCLYLVFIFIVPILLNSCYVEAQDFCTFSPPPHHAWNLALQLHISRNMHHDESIYSQLHDKTAYRITITCHSLCRDTHWISLFSLN